MSERKLAHVEIIKNLRPIEGADRIEVAEVLGWECVVKKGEFNIGDKIIYVEVDSIMPDKPEFEFLRDRKFRIKTIKLKGQISQGLVLPLNILDNYVETTKGIEKIKKALSPGDDVTQLIGITKYMSPSEKSEQEEAERRIKKDRNKLKKFMMRYSWFRRLFLSRKKKYGFPYWVSKTDEPRCISGDSILNTDKGDFTIKEICESKEIFKVKSYNIDMDTIEYKEIIDKSVKSNNNDWYEIELEDVTKVILTSEHPVYLPNLNCYRQVKDLKVNDLVLLDK